MEEKRRFAAGACGKASVLLAGALKSRYVFAAALLIAAGAAMHLAGGELFQPAFAEQSDVSQTPTGNSYHRSMSESMSVVSTHGSGATSPTSHYRSVSESMSVTSIQGKAPNSYSRSLSEQASLTTGTPPAPAGPQLRAASAPAAPYSASSNQRIDERINLRNLAGGKADPGYRSTAAGTPVFSTDSTMSANSELSGSDINIIFDTASVDAGESESGDHSSLQYVLAEMGATQYGTGYIYATNVVFATQGLAVVAIALGKSQIARRTARTSNARLLIAIFSSPSEKTPTQTRILVILVVLFSAAASSFAGPILGEAAGDTNKAAIVYIEGSIPMYREWIPSTGSWSSPVSLTAADTTLNTVKIEFSPTSSKRGIVTMDNNGNLDSYVCFSGCIDSGNWTHGNNFVDVTTSTVTASYRPWDIEYEQTSGDLMIVYDYPESGSSNADDLFYRIMTDSQTSFGSESSINDSGNTVTAGLYSFVAMDSQKTSGSDEMAFIAIDDTANDASVIVWNGNDWTTLPQTQLSTGVSIQTEEAVAIAYETSSGDILAVAGEGSAVRHNTFSNAINIWGISSTTTGTWAVGTINWLKLVPDPRRTSNAIFLGGLGSSLDLDSAYWSGSAWTDHGEHDGDVTSHAARIFDFAWDGSSSNGVLAWSTADTSISFSRGDPSSGSFGTDGTFTVDTGAIATQWIRLAPNPTAADTVAAIGLESDELSDIAGIRWDGDTNNPVSSGTDDISATSTFNGWEPSDIDFQKVPVSRSFSDSMGVSDTIAAVKTIPRTATEQIDLSETIAAQIITRAMAEQLAAADTIARAFAGSRSMSESAGVTDAIAADKFIPRSMTEQLGLQDRLHRSLNGYSAGTVYRSDTGEFGLDSPKYRQWDSTANIWSPEVELPDTGSEIRDVRIAFSPVSEMRVVVGHSADGTLNLFRCDEVCIDESSWTLVSADFADTGTPSASAPYRFFDIAFEQLSGTFLIVYDRTASQANDFYYRTYDGTTLAGELGHDYQNNPMLLDSETIPFFRMASKPGSDEIAMVLEDFTRQDAYAFIFDATTGLPSTSTQVTLTSSMGTTSIDGEVVGIAYEPGSGRAVAFSANNADSMSYAVWSGTAWSSVSTVDPNTGASGNDILFMTVKASPDPSSDLIMVCQVDDLLDLTCAEMENGALGSFTLIDGDINTNTARPFDFIWGQVGAAGMLVWGTTTDTLNTGIWNGASWVAPATVVAGGDHQWIVGLQAPTVFELGRALFLSKNSDSDIGSLAVVGSSLFLIGNTTHTADTSGFVTEGMGIDWQIAGPRQPFRLPVDQLAVTTSISISVTKPRSEAMSLTDSVRPTSVKPLTENLAVTDTISRVVIKPLSESAALSDTITATRVVTRSMTEQLGVADTIARTFTGSRSASEQLTLTESITKAVSVAMSEQLGVTDSVNRVITVSKSVSDQFGITDAIAKAVSKPLTEQAGVTDTAARSVVQSRLVSEQFAITDAVTKAAAKQFSEQLGITDTVARSIVSARSTAEQMIVTDSVAKVVSHVLSESLGITESAARAIMVTRAMTEQLGVTETIARSTVQSRSVAEQLGLTDMITKSVSKSLSEQLGMTEDVTRSIVLTRALSEQLGVTDTTTKAVSIAISEQMAVTEAAARSTIQSRSMTEQMTLADTLAKSASKRLSEQMAVTESAARTELLARSMSEQLGVTDVVTKAVATTLTEQVALQDILTRAITLTRTAEVSLALQDAIAKAVSKAVAEQLIMTETAARSVVQSRPAQEQLDISDTITVAIVKSLSESLGVTDAIARSVDQSVSMTEQMATQDTVSVSIVKTISEQMTVTDTLARATTASRSATEQLGVTESVSTSALKSTTEDLAITDFVAMHVSRLMTEQLGVSETAGATVSAVTMAESITLADAVSVTISRSASDQLGITESISISISKSIADNLAVSDAIVPTAPGSASESLSITESIVASPAKPLTDQLGVSDSISIAMTILVADQLSMSESAVAVAAGEALIADQLGATEFIAIMVSKQVADNLALSDTVMTAGSVGMAEPMAVADLLARSVNITRAISDGFAVSDAASGSPVIFVIITDSMAIEDDFTNISIVFNLNLAQALVLAQGFATNFEGVFDQVDSEAISIEANVTLVLSSVATLSEIFTLQDQITAEQINGRMISESMQASDTVIILITRPPPPPPDAVDDMPELMITETEDVDEFEGLTDPMEAVEIEGEWDIQDLDEESLESLLEIMGMPVYDVSLEANSDDICDLTMVLPTFWLSMEGEWSNDAGFLTPMLSELPACMDVIVPVNIEGSLEGDENLDMLGNMTVNFNTAEDTGNFAMLVTILDDNPDAEIPQEELPEEAQFYIHVTIVGDFEPGVTPDLEEFFDEPPSITFTLTEEWAVEQATERDENGVPIIGLFLLDESDGDWLELTAELESPTFAVDDTYTYTAILPHFSTYVITAGATGGDSSSAGGGSEDYSRSLVESMFVSSDLGAPLGSEGKIVIKDITDSLAVSAIQGQPLHQRVITVHNVTVAVNVADVKPAAAFGTAVATLNFEITNKNGVEEELVLRYWYSDPASGKMLYEGEQTITVGAGQSLVLAVEIPFYSEGIFDLMIEAGSDDGTIATTDIAVNVPWLAIYLYVLVVIAIAVVLISLFYVIFAMRRSRSSDKEER